MTNEIVMKIFFETQLKNSVNNVLNALEKLQPINLTLENIVHLYEWIEENYRTEKYPYKHVNVFGTGGDKTINISTISTILASKHIEVVKVGTRAVTSNWGSLDFVNKLKQKNDNKHIYYNDRSDYVGLPDLGYHYSPCLVEARKKLYMSDMLDIYKLIFPLVNLTGATSQVNGVHRVEYLNYYIHVYKELKKDGIIIYNDNDIDEIYFGRNYLYCFKKGVLFEKKVIDISESSIKDLEYFKESSNVEGHLLKFDEIIKDRAPSKIKEVVLMNVASIMWAFYGFENSIEYYFGKLCK